MNKLSRFIPFTDLRGYKGSMLWADLSAASAIMFLAIPQGVAYAIIAGLDPKMGLYASIAPTIIGSLFRSSRHVVTAPTNAISLLVAGAVVVANQNGQDATTVAVTLAFLVGAMQFGAGVFRLGSILDYISSPVVLGYITGAGVLIGVGQLPNITNTAQTIGNMFQSVSGWIGGVSEAHTLSVIVAIGSLLLLLILRRLAKVLDKPIPSALITMVAALGASVALDLKSQGVLVVSDIGNIPSGLPDLVSPDLTMTIALLPMALACTVLSLVESTSVARSISQRTGQKLDSSVEFTGQGLANLAAAFSGAYPTSGSLSKSALNEQSGASSRLSGVLAGLLVLLAVLVAGEYINAVPIASLAGLLLVVAYDLIDYRAIKATVLAHSGDRLVFLGTLLATWMMPLDRAIYFGVGVSIFVFLRQSRMISVTPLRVGSKARLIEGHGDVEDSPSGYEPCECPSIKLVNVEGSLFYGASGQLYSRLAVASSDSETKALILRIKGGQGLDVTTSTALVSIAKQMASSGRRLLIVGVTPSAMSLLDKVGATDEIGRDNIFPARPGLFEAMDLAIKSALAGPEHSHEGVCPLKLYIESRSIE